MIEQLMECQLKAADAMWHELRSALDSIDEELEARSKAGTSLNRIVEGTAWTSCKFLLVAAVITWAA
jgi:hypothetical protein